ncbi:unnamed protein product [Calypogeia fissa]
MVANEEMSSLFPIFVISVLGLVTTPWTIYRISGAVARKRKNLHCRCSECMQSSKYQTSFSKKVWNFLTLGNVTLVISWLMILGLFYWIKLSTQESQPFDPFLILGLEATATDGDIKKAYRKLSVMYHPDKNPDPEANKYFVDYISKAYQALTDPVSRENFAKYGHPDGRQGMQMGIALPKFLLDIHGASGGLLLLGLVGVGILVPLIVAVCYLSRSSKYTGNYVMHQTLSSYFYFMKPSLAPSKVVDVFVKAAEFVEIPVRRSDDLQKLFMVVRSELNLDPKSLKQEQAKFWKKHPALIKTELLLLAQLMREVDSIPSNLKADFSLVMKLTPRLLEELMKMAVIPRNAEGHGWLRPALGVMELSQSIIQAVPLSARKLSERAITGGGNVDGVAPFLQLPHFKDVVIKRLVRKKVRCLQDLRDLSTEDREEVLTSVGGLSKAAADDVQAVLEIMPSISLDVVCETEGEEGIQEGDIVTMRAWVTLSRENGQIASHPHAPYFPNLKDEAYWFLLADQQLNSVWVSQRLTFMDEAAAVATGSKLIGEALEGTGADDAEVNSAVKAAVERVKGGSRLAIKKFQAPQEGTYNLTAFCLCDTWIGLDKKFNVKLKVGKRSRAEPSPKIVAEDDETATYNEEDMEDGDEEEEDYDSEYSDEEGEEEEGNSEKWIKGATASLLEKSDDEIEQNH